MEYKEIFKRYLEESYDSYSKINTLVTTDNKRFLKDIYLPLTLCDNQKFKGSNKIVVEGMPNTFKVKGKKILIVDKAGMGKSTLTKRIFLDVYEKKEFMPVYIELRRITDTQPLTFQIAKLMGIKQRDMRDMLDEFQKGRTIFFFDGFDELQLGIREKVRSKLQDFISQLEDNIFIMTSRPEDSFDDFVGFEKYFIQPLTKEESYQLIKKHDTNESVSSLLIDKLKQKENKAIEEYLANPLLVSLLYAAFNFKKTIPLKKHLFYEQVYDAYFEKHDSTKADGFAHEKKSNLDSYDFERILRILGFICMKTQRIELTDEQLAKMIESAKSYCPDLNFKTEDFIDDLMHSVPLFCTEGLFRKWVHRSLQEFFSARFIYVDSKTEQDELLQAMLNSDRVQSYYNIFDIYFDIDNYGFLKNVSLPLLEEFKDFYETNKVEISGIADDYIDQRIGLMFLRKTALGSIGNYGDMRSGFELIRERCRENSFPIMSIHSYTGNDPLSLFTAEWYDMRLHVITLLKVRQPELFMDLGVNVPNSDERFLKNLEFCKIKSVSDFSENDSQYQFVNYCLMHGSVFYSTILKYERVASEIDRIKSMVRAKEDGMFFLKGL